MTPASGYLAEAWGGKLVPKNNPEGTREYVSRPIQDVKDWHQLKKLEPRASILSRELKALSLIRRSIGGKTPIVQTIFSPLTIAKNLTGNRWIDDLRSRPDDLHTGLDIIRETVLTFAQECLQAGADGLFFATQLASADFLTPAEYKAFGVEHDLRVLEKLARNCEFLILHIHGLSIFFDLLKDYPGQILHWHDQRTAPALGEGQQRSGKTVLGGLDEWGVLLKGTPAEIRARVCSPHYNSRSQYARRSALL